MLRLEDLPAEILLRIYEFVFQGTLVHPNPIMWAKQPSCDDKAKFEHLQTDWPGPVGLLMTSKFFNATGPLVVKLFYTKATFCFGVQWQWPAFASFLRQKDGSAIDPARLITSIMDTTPLFSSQSHLDLDHITVKTLPNLKHVYLNLFSVTSNCTGRVISRIYGYEHDDQVDCQGCESDYHAFSKYEYWARHGYCAYHRSPDPAIFALPRLDTLIGRESGSNGPMYCCSPGDFILSGFFNTEHPSPRNHRHPYLAGRRTQGAELKKRIMDDLVTVHLSWEMVFDRDTYGEEDIRVDSCFDSSDWKVRYNWNGKAYEVQQIKPQSFNPITRRFLP